MPEATGHEKRLQIHIGVREKYYSWILVSEDVIVRAHCAYGLRTLKSSRLLIITGLFVSFEM